jgi:hypothetical protein
MKTYFGLQSKAYKKKTIVSDTDSACGLGNVDFWIFNFLQFAIDGKNNSKTKVEKVCDFIFIFF